jgi:hypothetical protein
VSISLKQRGGNVFHGSVTARADGNGTMTTYNIATPGGGPAGAVRVEKDTFVLTQWGELRKQ